MLKIGHRGAKSLEPENTLLSFQKAIEIGVDGIELDVRLTSDGELVVIHDETIDRTSNGNGFVNQFTLKEIQKFRIHTTQEIPTLKAVLELVNRKCFINIELKELETAEKVVALIEDFVTNKNWNYSDFLVSSFNWHAIQNVRFLNSDIPIGVLTESDLEMAFTFAKFLKATTIIAHYLLLNEADVDEIQEAGIKIFAWTVNEKEAIEKMKTLKINGIISDFPDRL
jgi:glycerophosphoryl diester phosphodiesterase